MGLLTPLSGPLQYLGPLSSIPVNLAIEDVNAAGGVNGSPVILITEDSPFDPRQAVTLVRKLTEQDNVFTILGPYASGEFQVTAPLSVQLKVPNVSPSAMIEGISAGARPWSFEMDIPQATTTPQVIADFKKAYPNIKKVVLVGDTKEAVNQYAMKNVLPKAITDSGLQLLETIEYASDMTDFSPIVSKIRAANPDGIVLSPQLPTALPIAKEMQKQQMKIPVAVNFGLSGNMPEVGGSAVEGWVFASYADPEDPSPAVQSFFKRFFERANADPKITPKPKVLLTEAIYYDSAIMLMDSMRKGGVNGNTPVQDARQKIQEQMNAIRDFKGVSGIKAVGADGQAIWKAPPSVMVSNGQYKFIR